MFLIATAVDANNQLFPIAFGVVDAENDQSKLALVSGIAISRCAPNQLVPPEKLIFLSDRLERCFRSLIFEYYSARNVTRTPPFHLPEHFMGEGK